MYSQKFSSANPGCIIILIDQSYSMSDPWGEYGTKAEILSSSVNKVLLEIGRKCKNNDMLKERVEIAIIGYSNRGEDIDVSSAFPFEGSVDNDGFLVNIKDLTLNIKKQQKKVSIPNGEGGIVQIDKEIPYWFLPKAQGGTPMKEAFEEAEKIVKQWTIDSKHKDAFPPIVMNITDGEYNPNNSPEHVVERIKSLKTSDGNALVFNIHIHDGMNEIVFPKSDFNLTGYALELFNWSSSFPKNMVSNGKKLGFESLTEDSKGFIFNGDAVNVVKFLEFGTVLQLTNER